MAVIAGNLKMHMASDQAIEFLAELDLSGVSEGMRFCCSLLKSILLHLPLPRLEIRGFS